MMTDSNPQPDTRNEPDSIGEPVVVPLRTNPGPPLRASARQFAVASLLTSTGLILVIALAALSSGDRNLLVVDGLAFLLMICLLGLGLSRILQAVGSVSDQNEQLRTLVSELAAQLQRLPQRLTLPPAQTSATNHKLRQLAEIRHAIRQNDWLAATSMLDDYKASSPDDPEGERIAQELEATQGKVREDLLAKLKMAQEVNDPDRVLDLRENLRPLLDTETPNDFDRDLGRWFMLLIQKRLRTGTVNADVAVLAGRVATVLDQTLEGASLRASLPTLRRAAGLCPKCGQVYRGLADACPQCVAQALQAQKTTQVHPVPANETKQNAS